MIIPIPWAFKTYDICNCLFTAHHPIHNISFKIRVLGIAVIRTAYGAVNQGMYSFNGSKTLNGNFDV